MERERYSTHSADFVNNFWGRDYIGFKIVQEKLHNGLATLKELIKFYEERIQIEKDYNKKLEKLNSKMCLGANEVGSLKRALDKMNIENRQMQKDNVKFIKSLSEVNLMKVSHFYSVYHKRVGKIEQHMLKLINKYEEAKARLDQCKEKYRKECSQVKSGQLMLQSTWGKEHEKTEQKVKRLMSSIESTKSNYMNTVSYFKDINSIYERDWSLALQEIYELEIERIQVCKVNTFNFCNNVATLCVDNDRSADLARTIIAQVSPANDTQVFGDKYGTGNKIFNPPDFINFMEGFCDDDAKTSYKLASNAMPDHTKLIAKSYSLHSVITNSSNRSPIDKTTTPAKDAFKDIPKIPPATPDKDLPFLHDTADLKKTKLDSVYSISPDENKNDIFSINEKLAVDEKDLSRSNGSSNYSQPTNYSHNSGSERNWSSPRKREQQLARFQEGIDLKSQESMRGDKRQGRPYKKEQDIPIMKDFSIDFIAKALEDLNSGGNGDVNEFRRSVRESKINTLEQSKSAPVTPHNKTQMRTKSDYVDDHDEIATRYNSAKLTTPMSNAYYVTPDANGSPIRKQQRPRPKSMLLDGYRGELDQTVSSRRKSLLKSPTKSYHDLHSIISQTSSPKVTPFHKCKYITKAKAIYTYKPSHEGELFFKKGWSMYIIHKQEDNWFVAELASNNSSRDGTLGLVPGNYIKEGDNIF